jgi:hypothetical protein
MHSYRLTRHQAEVIEAMADTAASAPWSPDGLTFDVLLPLKGPSNAQLRRSGAPAPTTWLSMDDDERAAIRRRLRAVRNVEPTRIAAERQLTQDSGPAAVA